MIEAGRGTRPAFLAVSTLVLALSACGGSGTGKARLVISTEAEPVEIAVEVADTPSERSRGLMGRAELGEDAGMVFLDSEPTASPFWMKGTLIPLSVAFWDEGGRIFTIRHMEPCRAEPCPLYQPGGLWIGAVEVNRGFFEEHGVRVGDRVRLER